MPDAFYRFLAFRNGIIAMIALGWSLWRVTTSEHAAPAATLVEVGAR